MTESSTPFNVIKRDGSNEPLTVEKFDKVCTWACEGIKGVSSSELALKTYDKLYDNITTSQIHETLIKTAVELISEKVPNYDKVASRLVSFQIRKQVFGTYIPCSLKEMIEQNIERGLYTEELLDWYSEEEISELDSHLDHSRDDWICYAGIEQLRSKYLAQDRSKGEVYETPQFRFMIIAMGLFSSENKETRLKRVKDYYDVLTEQAISIPSPVAGGVGTPVKQFSSCCLIPVSDNLDSINAAASSIVNYAANRAGIGIDIGKIRGVGAPVKNGLTRHTGIIPFIKYMKGALKSCSQGGLRGASATVHYPWFHYEFADLIVLKNNQGTEETRERQMDYSVQFNDYFFNVLLPENKPVYHFCNYDSPELYDAFYVGDDEKFGEIYEKYCNDPSKRKTSIGTALTVLDTYLKEFFGTGRIYSMNMSAAVNQGPFNKVKDRDYWLSSNLCVAPETKILTRNGHEVISELVDQTVEVWNGEEFSEVVVRKTGENQELITVVTDVGSIVCTRYHHFFIQKDSVVQVEAKDLNPGDKLIKFDLPSGEVIEPVVIEISSNGRFDDTYCFTEPKRGMGVFNGILTGQCQEIVLPIKDFDSIFDRNGLISLCTLSSINWGKLNKKEDLEKPCRMSVRALDNLLSYQDYMAPQAEESTRKFRPLGIGIVGLAHFLAKNNLRYNIDAAPVIDEYMEAMMYYLIDESVKLAEERGPCDDWKDTCYAEGIFPWERRNKNIDKVVKHKTRYDWEELRERVKKFGIRNAVLGAVAPTETSSQLLGETNGIEPPVSMVTQKISKDGTLKIVVPEILKLKNKYDYRWDMKNPRGYLIIMGVIQKWLDQSISTNLHYNPENYPNGEIKMSDIRSDYMFGIGLGLKTFYYSNTKKGDKEQEEKTEDLPSEYNGDDSEEHCESCVI